MTKGKELSDGLGVTPAFDVDAEITRRVSFLADYLRGAACRIYVLGISGGVDSLAARMLTIGDKAPAKQVCQVLARNALALVQIHRNVCREFKLLLIKSARAPWHSPGDRSQWKWLRSSRAALAERCGQPRDFVEWHLQEDMTPPTEMGDAASAMLARADDDFAGLPNYVGNLRQD